MYYDVDARVLKEADFVISRGATVRAAAMYFGVSKSTVHYDLTKRLPFLDEMRAQKVRRVLSVNLSERHIRGGMATRLKYKSKK